MEKNFPRFPIIVRVLFGLFEDLYACTQKDRGLRGNREISPLWREFKFLSAHYEFTDMRVIVFRIVRALVSRLLEL